MADSFGSNREIEGGTDRGVLRARDVIPYGSTANEGKVIIPKFDLSREIMAGQRKTTAEKRQGPGEKAELPRQQGNVGLGDHRLIPPHPEKTEADKALTDIVARDIARLCGTEP